MRVAFVVPGRLDEPTGGSRYDRMMVDGLRARGWRADVHELEGAFPLPSVAARRAAALAFQTIADGTVTVVDGLALGALPEIIEHESARLPIVALVHLPIASDVALDEGVAAGLENGERRALGAARRIVVTGEATLSLLERYGIARADVAVVEPGTPRRLPARGSGSAHVQLLCVATLQPGKGHAILLEALGQLPHRSWCLTCVGSVTRDAATAARVRDVVRALGMDDSVTLAGELDEALLSARYDESDVFVLATLQETYGMAVAEAVAHGLPVVSTTCGAIPAIVGADAGLLVTPGDSRALAAALARVIDDKVLRARLAEGARQMRERLPAPEQAVARLAALLEETGAHD